MLAILPGFHHLPGFHLPSQVSTHTISAMVPSKFRTMMSKSRTMEVEISRLPGRACAHLLPVLCSNCAPLQGAEELPGGFKRADAGADTSHRPWCVPSVMLSLIHISEPTRLGMISYA